MKKIIIPALLVAAVTASILTLQRNDFACTVLGIPNAARMCNDADDIVRATAVEYALPPAGNIRTTGVPDSKVQFRVDQVLKGDTALQEVTLNGYLSEKDDFNDQQVPYTFVRSNGRRGSCFANTYKRGSQFLLFLKQSKNVKWPGITTRLTVDFAALAPVNEQLHSARDPWVYYIEGVLEGLNGPAMFHK